MSKKKIFVISITALLFMGVIFSVNAYHEYIGWAAGGDQWEGAGHDGCGHQGVTGAIASVNATLDLTLNFTGDLAPREIFELEIDVLNFTEALATVYARRIMLSIPSGVGDNHLFSSPIGAQTFNRRERVDSTWGSYNPSDDDNVFILEAPKEAGVYDLYGLVLVAMNHSAGDGSAYNITFVQDSVSITVVAPSDPPADPPASGIPGYILPVMVATIAIVGAVLIIKRKRQL